MTLRPAFLLLTLIALGAACSRVPFGNAGPAPDLTLALILNKTQYEPGEPVIVTLALANTTGSPRTVPQLDQASVAFTFQPAGKTGPGDLKFADPVRSSKETPGTEAALTPQGTTSGTLTRVFVFTTLTMERGQFVVAAVYTRPSAGPLKPAAKTYARPAAFTVAGEKAWTHRYLDGLLAREDAIKVAQAKAGGKTRSAEAMLINDEAGFKKWWVNVTPESGPVKSYFIDPVFARVWKEARPFTDADRVRAQPIAPDAKVLQKLRDESSSRRAK